MECRRAETAFAVHAGRGREGAIHGPFQNHACLSFSERIVARRAFMLIPQGSGLVLFDGLGSTVMNSPRKHTWLSLLVLLLFVGCSSHAPESPRTPGAAQVGPEKAKDNPTPDKGASDIKVIQSPGAIQRRLSIQRWRKAGGRCPLPFGGRIAPGRIERGLQVANSGLGRQQSAEETGRAPRQGHGSVAGRQTAGADQPGKP